nr:hypothetical protein [Streptomyces sp. F63]
MDILRAEHHSCRYFERITASPAGTLTKKHDHRFFQPTLTIDQKLVRAPIQDVADVRTTEVPTEDVWLASAEEAADLGGRSGLIVCLGKLCLRSALTSSSGFSSDGYEGGKFSSIRSLWLASQVRKVSEQWAECRSMVRRSLRSK